MSRRRTNSRKRKQNNILGVIAIFCIFLVIFTIMFFALRSVMGKEELDKVSMCPKKGEKAITSILIDQTDPLTPIQQMSLKNELLKIRDKINKHEKLEIYLIDNTEQSLLTPIFSLCSPGRGKDASRLHENQRLIEKKWRNEFDKPLAKILSSFSKVEPGNQSPIMESVQSISVSSFNKPESLNIKKHLIIASDMLQHTKQFSLYKKKNDIKTVLSSNKLQKFYSDLRDVEVEILLFRRTTQNNLQSMKYINFWSEYFSRQNATVERIYSITG